MKIYTVGHKEFKAPDSDIYVPLIVGNNKVNIKGAVRDNTGDNISHMNGSLCEMTAIYWVWKNNICNYDDIVGLVHYRRYFGKGNLKRPLNELEVRGLLKDCDVIIPKKRCYYVTTIKGHYSKAHYKKDLNITKEIISKNYPDDLKYFDKVLNSRSVSLYNMMITRKKIFDNYCEWVFPILFELDYKIDKSEYNQYQSRVVGFLAERLFNVWLEKNKEKLKIKYVKVFNTDGDEYIKKSLGFIKRQFLTRG